MKKKMIENQKKLRLKKDTNNESEKDVNEKINETLEDMYIWKYYEKRNSRRKTKTS